MVNFPNSICNLFIVRALANTSLNWHSKLGTLNWRYKLFICGTDDATISLLLHQHSAIAFRWFTYLILLTCVPYRISEHVVVINYNVSLIMTRELRYRCLPSSGLCRRGAWWYLIRARNTSPANHVPAAAEHASARAVTPTSFVIHHTLNAINVDFRPHCGLWRYPNFYN